MELTQQEVEDRHEELTAELEYIGFLQQLYYLADEGFIEIDSDGRCWPAGESCPNSL